MVHTILNLAPIPSSFTLTQQKFFNACENGDIEDFWEFMKSGENPQFYDNQHCSPFYMACKNGHQDLVLEMLTDGRVDLSKGDEFSCTPLHVACQNQHIAVVILLLQHGADPNCKDRDNDSCFSDAVNQDRVEIVKLLLDSGSLTLDTMLETLKISNTEISSSMRDVFQQWAESQTEVLLECYERLSPRPQARRPTCGR